MDAIKEAMIRDDDGLSAKAQTPRQGVMIIERLRNYNPPDRTHDDDLRQIAVDIHEAADEIERLRAALEACAADWISAEGTVIGAAQQLSGEFRRRMEIAHRALFHHGRG